MQFSLLGPPRGIASAEQRGGETIVVLFDYGDFVCSYETVISDIPVFDAGIEILTQSERFALTPTHPTSATCRPG